MPIFYRGAGPGSYWHKNDARYGFRPHSPAASHGPDRIALHVARGTTTTPYVSVTRSYGVAKQYALLRSGRRKSGWVYEIQIDLPMSNIEIIDPVKAIASQLPDAFAPPYQYDGFPDFLHGVVSPLEYRQQLERHYPQPPPAQGTSRPANLTIELETLVRALRDAELLVLGPIPARCVTNRFKVIEEEEDGFVTPS